MPKGFLLESYYERADSLIRFLRDIFQSYSDISHRPNHAGTRSNIAEPKDLRPLQDSHACGDGCRARN
ncbi:hypothetical protein EMIT0194P_360007 [Pseudomonas serbica]